MKKVGRPKVAPGEGIDKRFTVAFNVHDFLRLNDHAVFEGCSMAKVVRRAVEEFLRIHRLQK